jgi:hypothetical protein
LLKIFFSKCGISFSGVDLRENILAIFVTIN